MSRLVAIRSRLGWVGVCHNDYVVSDVKFGFDSRSLLVKAFGDERIAVSRNNLVERNWVSLFRNFANTGDALSEISIDTLGMTDFQRRVVNCCREIPSGETATYMQLAALAGSPGAARAVGSVMRKNRTPLIVPCHRVLSANGLGGYSAGNGLDTKLKLLKLEGVDVSSWMISK